MQEKKTSVFANGLVWFGAGVSIAEILTGTLLAPLGLARGAAAMLLGHLIGGVMFFLAGLIGAQTGESAMQTVSRSFGRQGAKFFSLLNVLQLVGWTAVMIESGAAASAAVLNLGGEWVWSLIIGALIVVWIVLGLRSLERINVVTMLLLFVLTLVLSARVFRGAAGPAAGESLTFGAAVELSAAMPLSWLPLVSDYTRTAKRPFAATLTSALVYTAVSAWMFLIGMGAALFTGESDIAAILLKVGLGAAGLVIAVFSTVTTTYLDAWSAGVSAVSVSSRLREKPAGVAVCAVGTALAIFAPVTRFPDFLYLIGSVFAPMAAIQITDYFLLKKNSAGRRADWLNLVLWLAGFLLYRALLRADTPVGNTLPDMVVTALLCLAANKISDKLRKNS